MKEHVAAKFAIQNTLRNRRRSLVTVSIAALGTAAILLAGGFAPVHLRGTGSGRSPQHRPPDPGQGRAVHPATRTRRCKRLEDVYYLAAAC